MEDKIQTKQKGRLWQGELRQNVVALAKIGYQCLPSCVHNKPS